MARHFLKKGVHQTWNVTSSDDVWVVRKKILLEVYNGDGISDTSAQKGNLFKIAGRIEAGDGEGLNFFGRGNKVIVAESGVIETAHGLGIAFEGTASGGRVDNHGRISSEFAGIGMFGAPGSGGSGIARIDNSGTIIGGSYGIDSREGDLSIVNRAGGRIEGGYYGIGSVSNDLAVDNDGTIKGGIQGAVKGGSGNDTVANSGRIIGDVILNEGNDTFTNSGGTVTGIVNLGVGNDVYVVDDEDLKLKEDDFSDSDRVESSVSWVLGDNFENLTLNGNAAINGTGNAENNVIKGNGSANSLAGAGGDDTLKGGGGADIFAFATGSGRDTITDFSDGEDRIDLSAYTAIKSFGDIASIDGGNGKATITLSGSESITLENIAAGQIDVADFIFSA